MVNKHVKRLSINHEGNTKNNHIEISPHTHTDGYYYFFKYQITSVEKDVEKFKHMHTVGRNAKGAAGSETGQHTPEAWSRLAGRLVGRGDKSLEGPCGGGVLSLSQ